MARGLWRWLWRKSTMVRLEGTRFPSRFRLVYLVPDPWRLNTHANRLRYEWTNQLIADNWGRPRRLLEVGCGEGSQTGHLLELCTDIVGIDLSHRAIQRARQRHPGLDLRVGDALVPPVAGGQPFDLVVACEVLYYARDIEAALGSLKLRAAHGLVTCHEPSSSRVIPILNRAAGSKRASLTVGTTTWLAWWW